MIDDKFVGNKSFLDGIKLESTSSLLVEHGFGPKTRARARALEAKPDAWCLEPHVCRVCFSRLVSRPNPKQGLDAQAKPSRLYHCTNCGLEAAGSAPEVLCACGMKMRKSTKSGRTRVALADAGIRCTANPQVRSDFLSLFIAQAAPDGLT